MLEELAFPYIKELVDKILQPGYTKGKKCSGGFIFSPGCDLPPTILPINAWMMTKAARDFGWYNSIANMAKLQVNRNEH